MRWSCWRAVTVEWIGSHAKERGLSTLPLTIQTAVTQAPPEVQPLHDLSFPYGESVSSAVFSPDGATVYANVHARTFDFGAVLDDRRVGEVAAVDGGSDAHHALMSVRAAAHTGFRASGDPYVNWYSIRARSPLGETNTYKHASYGTVHGTCSESTCSNSLHGP